MCNYVRAYVRVCVREKHTHTHTHSQLHPPSGTGMMSLSSMFLTGKFTMVGFFSTKKLFCENTSSRWNRWRQRRSRCLRWQARKDHGCHSHSCNTSCFIYWCSWRQQQSRGCRLKLCRLAIVMQHTGSAPHAQYSAAVYEHSRAKRPVRMHTWQDDPSTAKRPIG